MKSRIWILPNTNTQIPAFDIDIVIVQPDQR